MLTTTTSVPVDAPSTAVKAEHLRRHAGAVAEDELADLYRSHAPAIYRRCKRILCDAAAAEDAQQEIFIRVLRHSGAVPPPNEVRRWMFRIALNFCLNVLRNTRCRALAHQAVSSEIDLQRAERALHERDILFRLIDRAPPSLRLAAWLHMVEGLEQEKVAERLGLSRRTVCSRLSAFSRYVERFRAQTALESH